MATIDTKRGYVGNRRSAQQESGAASSKNSMFTAGAFHLISIVNAKLIHNDTSEVDK